MQKEHRLLLQRQKINRSLLWLYIKKRTRTRDPGPDPCKTRTLIKFYGVCGNLDFLWRGGDIEILKFVINHLEVE